MVNLRRVFLSVEIIRELEQRQFAPHSDQTVLDVKEPPKYDLLERRVLYLSA